MANPHSKAYFFLITTTLCWGANTVFAKLAVGEVSPMMLIMWRWLGVVVIALVLARAELVRQWPLVRRHLGFLAAMGALGFTAFNALFYSAAHQTTALNMGIVQGTIPVFVMLGSFAAFRTRVNTLQIVGVLATITGVVAVAAEGDITRLLALQFNPGDLMMITACLLYAVYAVWLQQKPDISAVAWFAMLASAALLASLPLAAVEWLAGAGSWPTPRGWLLISLIVFFPSFLAQIFFIRGVELIGPNRSSVFTNLVPIIASIAAVVVLDEAFRWFHGLALVLVLGGIWIAERFAPGGRV